MSVYRPNPYSLTPDPPGVHIERPGHSLAHDYLEYREIVENLHTWFCVGASIILCALIGCAGGAIARSVYAAAIVFAISAATMIGTCVQHDMGQSRTAKNIRARFPSVLHWVLDTPKQHLPHDDLERLRMIPSARSTTQSAQLDRVSVEQYTEALKDLQK